MEGCDEEWRACLPGGWGLFVGAGWWGGGVGSYEEDGDGGGGWFGEFKDVQAAVDSAPEGNLVVKISRGLIRS